MNVSDEGSTPGFRVFLEHINAFLFAIAPKISIVIYLHNLARQITQCLLLSFVSNMLCECEIHQAVFSQFLLEWSILNKCNSFILILSYFVSIFLRTLHFQSILVCFCFLSHSSIAVRPLNYKRLLSVKELEIRNIINSRKQYMSIQEYNR